MGGPGASGPDSAGDPGPGQHRGRSYSRATVTPSPRAGKWLLDVEQNLTLVPEALQIIVGALFRAKEVYDHVAVIEQDPFRFPAPLLAPGYSPVLFFDRLEDALLQGL